MGLSSAAAESLAASPRRSLPGLDGRERIRAAAGLLRVGRADGGAAARVGSPVDAGDGPAVDLEALHVAAWAQPPPAGDRVAGPAPARPRPRGRHPLVCQ